jgi:hypothetical protein
MRGLLKCAFLLPYFAMAAPTLRTKGELHEHEVGLRSRYCVLSAACRKNCCEYASNAADLRVHQL